MALAAFLWTYRLAAKSYWDDEVLSIYHAQSLTKVSALLSLQMGNAHPPLYFLLLRFWMMAGSDREVWTRLLSALLAMPTLFLIFLIGRRFSSPRAGLMGAFLYAIMPLTLIYNREVRMYSLFVTLSCLSLYLLLKTIEKDSWYLWILFSLVTVLTLITHYHGFLVLFAEGVFFLLYEIVVERKSSKILRFIEASVLALLFYLPFVPALLDARFGTTGVMWQSGAKSFLVSLGYLGFSLALGQTIMPWNILAVLGGAAVAVLTVLGLLSLRKDRKFLILLLAYAAVVFAVGPVVSHNMPRYYVFFVPLLCLFLAHSAIVIPRKIPVVLLSVLVLASWAVSDLNYYANREFHVMGTVDPSREVAEYLSKAAAPDDAIIGGTQSFRRYYLMRLGLKNPIGSSLQQFSQDHGSLPPTVWLVVFNPISTKNSKIMIRMLTEDYGYHLADIRRYLRDPNYLKKQKYFRKKFAEYRIEVFKYQKTNNSDFEKKAGGGAKIGM
jgi:uncharacterized membrane protein